MNLTNSFSLSPYRGLVSTYLVVTISHCEVNCERKAQVKKMQWHIFFIRAVCFTLIPTENGSLRKNLRFKQATFAKEKRKEKKAQILYSLALFWKLRKSPADIFFSSFLPNLFLRLSNHQFLILRKIAITALIKYISLLILISWLKSTSWAFIWLSFPLEFSLFYSA